MATDTMNDLAAASDQPRLFISLLGAFRTEVDGSLLKPPKRRDAERLWVLLLVHSGVMLERARIVEMLWPDDEKGRTRLRQSLHALQKHLPEVADDRPWLLIDGEAIG